MTDRGAACEAYLLIVGAPRSGTTLIASSIEGAFGYAIPLETHVMNAFFPWRRLFGDQRDPANRLRFGKAVLDFIASRMTVGGGGRLPEQLLAHSLQCSEERLYDLSLNACGYSDLIRNLFDEYARRHGCRRVGDKSVAYDPVDVACADAVFPGLRVIHVLRDGRDVSLSWTNTWFGPADEVEAAAMWKRHVTGYRAWGAKHPHRYHEVRYEQFLSDPAQTLAGIGRFLGLEIQGDPERAHLGGKSQDIARNRTHHGKVGSKLDPKNCAKWKQLMSEGEAARFGAVAGDCLCSCGYEASPALSGAIASRGWRRLPSMLRRSAVRGGYAILPLLVWLWSLFGCRFSDLLARLGRLRG